MLIRRYIQLAAGLAAATAIAALPAGAAGAAGPPEVHNPAGHALGVAAVHNQAKFARTNTSNLSYHNGPVMLANTVYAIFVEPSGTVIPQPYPVDTNYNSLINQYFTDVARDSTLSSNVYFSDTQYYNSALTHIAYKTTLGGSWVDTSVLPTSGCTDKYTPVCLTDAQIQAEVKNAMRANLTWTADPSHLFFVFTAKNIGSCYGRSCAFSQYCAYHSWIGTGASAIMYANMPYAMTVPAACSSAQSPNNNDADATINVTSHEHNEAITDPQGSAWYDRSGYENGDKCAWSFGTALGSTGGSGTAYNQTINGDHYYLQQEWSNASSKCVLTGQ
jgi:hypothetical protein